MISDVFQQRMVSLLQCFFQASKISGLIGVVVSSVVVSADFDENKHLEDVSEVVGPVEEKSEEIFGHEVQGHLQTEFRVEDIEVVVEK